MKRFLLAAAAAVSTPVLADGCDEATIRGVARGGSIVVLDSGSVFEVAPEDTPDTALWNDGDSVLVCGDDEMVNTDKGDKVHVAQVR